MNYTYKIDDYLEIINLIAKWKIIELKNSFSIFKNSISFYTFKKRIRALEKLELIKATRIGSNKKYIYLTLKGLGYSTESTRAMQNEEILAHDVIVSEVTFEFLNYSKIIDGTSYPTREDSLEPDSLLIGERNRTEFKIALEIELTQKSRKRVDEKFKQYGNSFEYDFVVYITNSLRVINTYSRYLSEFDNTTQSKIAFVFIKELTPKNVNLNNSTCYFMGKETSIEELFGIKREQSIEQPRATACSRPAEFPD